MMLLPSGRSNSDVHPVNNTRRPQFSTRTSSPQLNINSGKKTENGGYASPESVSTPAPMATTGSEQYKNSYSAPNSTLSTPPSNHQSYTIEMANNGTIAATGNVLLSNSPGSQSETGTATAGRYTNGPKVTFLANGNISSSTGALTTMNSTSPGNWEDIDRQLEAVQTKLKEGWSAHLGKEGRLYYCNHTTQTSGWLPSCEDWSKQEELPYGWERAIDSKGRSYFINHLNKTSTYEAPECIKWDENPPEPRVVVLQRSSTMGFGFVAGSERPVIVRFVTEDGPSMNKLQPGDQILAVNGEDVKDAPRDRVIQLVRACETQVTLLVCQPAHNVIPGRKSTLLSAGKRAKLKTRPSRVRFAESVCVNGAPLFPPSAFSLGDICVPPMANVLKVFLENGQTKSFKYDATTTVQDVVSSLLDKLCFVSGEIFSLVLEHVKSLKRNKLTLLDPEESLAKIASRPGAHKLRCLFRVTFVPISVAELAQKDLNSLDYLYLQCCNDVTQERFAPELQPDVALRLAALHMHQHALANNVSASKLTVKVVEREFGLERFVPGSLFEGMKRKELRRLISHFLKMNAEMTGSSTKVLTQLQAKLHYLDIIASLPSYGAKCFSTNQREGVERVLLVSPRFGLSQISSARNSVPQPISAIEDFSHIIVQREDDITCSVTIYMQGDRSVKFFMEDRDACEFSLCLAGYYRLLTGKVLPVSRERETIDEDNPPSYLAQHTVLPAFWSYLLPFHNRAHSINFLMPPPYHPSKLKTQHSEEAGHLQEQSESMTNKTLIISECSHLHSNLPLLSSTAMDLDIHSVMATELLEEAKDSGMSDSSGGGSNCGDRANNNLSNTAKMEAKNEEVFRRVQEMQKMVENSEQYLNEQGELVQNFRLTNTNSSYSSAVVSWQSPTSALSSSNINSSAVIEFDSDCDSLNSSKLSSNEETPQQGSLKHSDSLVLLAETINHDLSGITQGLNSIGEHTIEVRRKKPTLVDTSSPRPERKVNGFSQLLSNLQALGTDFSQSESDSESIASPTNSPTARRPSLLNTNDKSSRKQNLAYRSSFGLHSPDSSNFGMETKDYNLKEYLKQLKEISNVDDFNQDTDVAAKKLSEIYGFEIREDTFIETDTDLIDLRAIPPPQTPDELDALSLLNAPPKGFGDFTKKTLNDVRQEHDLDKFLEKVVVAPPTQKATPAKELTPEEIMSFIIPPPPDLDEVDIITKKEELEFNESLYSNSSATNRFAKPPLAPKPNEDLKKVENKNHIIEYATVERKSKFSCCPKSKKEETTDACAEIVETLKPPPRSQSSEQTVPVRPPKSAELMQRYSPKKLNQISSPLPQRNGLPTDVFESNPPVLPPRTSFSTSPRAVSQEERQNMKSTVSPSAPKKPPLPPITARPMLRKSPLPMNYPGAIDVSSPPPTQPRVFPTNNTAQIHSPTVTPPSQPPPLLPMQQQINQQSVASNREYRDQRYPLPPYPLLSSPQMQRKIHNTSPINQSHISLNSPRGFNNTSNKLIIKNGHIIDPEALLVKTDVAMAGLLVKLDQVAAQCTAAQSAGGGSSIDEDKFQKARNELTEQTLVLVTASKYLVVAMSDMTLSSLPEHLTSCLTAIRRVTELAQDMTRHTSSPLQTRNIVLKVHDVASSFRELVGVQMGPLGAGQLALQAECLANVLATLLRSLRVFSP
ncbi:FERM and PDZ domain-containing protein 4 [Lucilia cuprina]|nr:FERM and PDZ domain-containing protein 4 [Lucilia cuprina]